MQGQFKEECEMSHCICIIAGFKQMMRKIWLFPFQDILQIGDRVLISRCCGCTFEGSCRSAPGDVGMVGAGVSWDGNGH